MSPPSLRQRSKMTRTGIAVCSMSINRTKGNVDTAQNLSPPSNFHISLNRLNMNVLTHAIKAISSTTTSPHCSLHAEFGALNAEFRFVPASKARLKLAASKMMKIRSRPSNRSFDLDRRRPIGAEKNSSQAMYMVYGIATELTTTARICVELSLHPRLWPYTSEASASATIEVAMMKILKKSGANGETISCLCNRRRYLSRLTRFRWSLSRDSLSASAPRSALASLSYSFHT